MQVLFSKKQISLLVFVVCLATFFLTSCSGDDVTVQPETTKSSLNGQWEITLSPYIIPVDTVHLSGMTSNNYSVSSSIISDVYLYEDDNGNLQGFSGPFKLTGKKTGKQVDLDVFTYSPGPVEQSQQTYKMASMSLTIDNLGFMRGTSKLLTDPDTLNLTQEIDSVFAKKIGGGISLRHCKAY